MFHNPTQYRSMPLGVVLRRSPGVTRWAKWNWTATAVLPGAAVAEWKELRRDGDVVEFHAATVQLDLHGAETESYLHGLTAQIPSVYVVLREISGEWPLEVALATVSPYEAQDYTDSGEETVEKVPMTPGLVAWVRDFVETFHEEEVFVKRKRDKKRIDLKEDGIGDPRIGKPADIYASPTLKRSRLI